MEACLLLQYAKRGVPGTDRNDGIYSSPELRHIHHAPTSAKPPAQPYPAENIRIEIFKLECWD